MERQPGNGQPTRTESVESNLSLTRINRKGVVKTKQEKVIDYCCVSCYSGSNRAFHGIIVTDQQWSTFSSRRDGFVTVFMPYGTREVR